MLNEQKNLITYATNNEAFDMNEKLKLILFALAVKPVTYVVLKVFPKKPQEAVRFEKMLNNAGIIFKKSRPKTFEEITGIKKNEIRWRIKGVWIGYDLFHTRTQKKEFEKYVRLAGKGRHTQADKIAGKLYDYPSCCVKDFIKMHNKPSLIVKKYSYHDYYKLMHTFDKKFPFIQHVPKSLNCKKTIVLNKEYKRALEKNAQKFLRMFSKKRSFKTDVLVDVSNDIVSEELLTTEGLSIWPVKDGHDYIFITKKPIDKKYWLISGLQKNYIERGAIFEAKIMMQYDYAEINLRKFKKQVGDLYHERKLPAQRK